MFLAGVGDAMTRIAGEVADGFLCHGFTTERYLRDVTLPALTEGRKAAGLSMDGYEISGLPFVVTGTSGEEMARSALGGGVQIAFYASTPAYRPVLDAHGWGALQEELTPMSKAGRWTEMRDLIDDDILDAFAIVAAPGQVAAAIGKRYGDLFTRVHLYLKAPLPKTPSCRSPASSGGSLRDDRFPGSAVASPWSPGRAAASAPRWPPLSPPRVPPSPAPPAPSGCGTSGCPGPSTTRSTPSGAAGARRSRCAAT